MLTRLPKEKAERRRVELRASFQRLVSFALDEGVRLILLAGDVFDGEFVDEGEREFFYGVIAATPEIDFFYLRGNHDGVEPPARLPNLKTFGREWSEYPCGGVTVSGVETDGENYARIYDTLSLDKNRTNILLLHGQISATLKEGTVCLNRLANRGIDYLALGHLHTFSSGRIDERGHYAYCGCLEGRGYDETGEKGFVLLETAPLRARFVPFATRTVHDVTFDVKGFSSVAQVLAELRRSLTLPAKDLLKLTIIGECDFDPTGIEGILEEWLKDAYFAVEVKNQAKKRLDLSVYTGQVSVEGEFVRAVLADGTLTEEEKKEVIRIGLKALAGERVL